MKNKEWKSIREKKFQSIIQENLHLNTREINLTTDLNFADSSYLFLCR